MGDLQERNTACHHVVFGECCEQVIRKRVSIATRTIGTEMTEASCPPHNALLSYISKDSELGRLVREKIEEDGYLVIPQALTAAECDRELDRLWNFVEAIAPTVSRDDPASWYPISKDTEDPWPHSGWKFLPDMCQSFRAGWLFSDLRELLAERIFEPLYGTRELHSSKEGFTFHRPTAPVVPGLVHPLCGKGRPFVCNQPTHTNGEHFDQRASHTGLQCIQSSTTLIDQNEEDGCFLCWPGSHKEHARMTKSIWRGRSDWVPLTDEECEELRRLGYSPKRVPVNKGDVILWRSDLCHCGAPPGCTTRFRAVSYTCMLPAELTPPNVLENKINEYKNGLTGDHRPNVRNEHLSVPKKRGGGGAHKTPKGQELAQPILVQGSSYFPQGYPELSWRQAELYGLVPYDSNNDREDQQREWLLVGTE